MSLTYSNLVRGSFLFLFLLSCGLCLFKPSQHSGLVSILSLIAFVAFDTVCAFKRPKLKDFTEDVEALRKQLEDTTKLVKEIKQDHSVLKLGASINRKG